MDWQPTPAPTDPFAHPLLRCPICGQGAYKYSYRYVGVEGRYIADVETVYGGISLELGDTDWDEIVEHIGQERFHCPNFHEWPLPEGVVTQ